MNVKNENNKESLELTILFYLLLLVGTFYLLARLAMNVLESS